MKKFLTVLFIIFLLLSSCKSGEPAGTSAVTEEAVYIDADPKDVMSAVYRAVAETETLANNKTMLSDEAVTDKNELYYLGINGISYVSAVASEPVMQADPYSFVVIKLQNGVDYDGQRRLIEQNLNKSKWVCMTCEEALAVRYENFIAVIMCDKETADALEAAYLSVMDSYKNGSI